MEPCRENGQREGFAFEGQGLLTPGLEGYTGSAKYGHPRIARGDSEAVSLAHFRRWQPGVWLLCAWRERLFRMDPCQWCRFTVVDGDGTLDSRNPQATDFLLGLCYLTQ